VVSQTINNNFQPCDLVWQLQLAYRVQGLSIAEDEVDGSFDIAILEVMAPNVITECILGSVEATAVESCHVSGNSKRGTLLPIYACRGRRCRVLPETKN
jgi:hypothetical protein